MPAIKPKGTAYDLRPLKNYLSTKKSSSVHKRALTAIINLEHTNSAVYDLLYTVELLQYLTINVGDNQKNWMIIPRSVSGACLSHAILLFVRATQPGSDRKPVSISGLTDEQKELSDRLQVLRNKSIAHFDNKRPYGKKSFADEVAVLVHEGTGEHRVIVAHRRISFNFDLVDQLLGLLGKAIDSANAQLKRQTLGVAQNLGELSKIDRNIGEKIESLNFDGQKFFGSEERAIEFISGEFFVPNLNNESVIHDDWDDDSWS